MARGWGLAWLLAGLLVLLTTVWPPSSLGSQPHWEHISWLPFADPSSKPWELLANVLLFVPFGYAGVRALGPGRRSVLLVSLLAGLLSLAVESAQVFAPARVPSTTDVLTNLVGAILGGAIASWRARA